MKIIKNNIIPFPGFIAMNLFGILFVRTEYADKLDSKTINHESIHTALIKELWYLPFYILYILEWIIRLFCKGNAYRNISFEKEAYLNEDNLEYLNHRKRFSMWKY